MVFQHLRGAFLLSVLLACEVRLSVRGGCQWPRRGVRPCPAALPHPARYDLPVWLTGFRACQGPVGARRPCNTGRHNKNPFSDMRNTKDEWEWRHSRKPSGGCDVSACSREVSTRSARKSHGGQKKGGCVDMSAHTAPSRPQAPAPAPCASPTGLRPPLVGHVVAGDCVDQKQERLFTRLRNRAHLFGPQMAMKFSDIPTGPRRSEEPAPTRPP